MACSADRQRRFSCRRYRVPNQISWHMRIQERLKAKALQRVTIVPIQLRTQPIRQTPGNRSQSDRVDFLIAQPQQVKQQVDGIRRILTIGLMDIIENWKKDRSLMERDGHRLHSRSRILNHFIRFYRVSRYLLISVSALSAVMKIGTFSIPVAM